MYSLNILFHNISNIKNNTTRFIILQDTPVNIIEDTSKIITLAFICIKKPQLLKNIHLLFKKYYLNIKYLTSQDISSNPIKSICYIDISYYVLIPSSIKNALSELHTIVDQIKILGCYTKNNY